MGAAYHASCDAVTVDLILSDGTAVTVGSSIEAYVALAAAYRSIGCSVAADGTVTDANGNHVCRLIIRP